MRRLTPGQWLDLATTLTCVAYAVLVTIVPALAPLSSDFASPTAAGALAMAAFVRLGSSFRAGVPVALMTLGCTASIPIKPASRSSADDVAVMIEAGEILGYPVEIVEDRHGSITVAIYNDLGNLRGQSFGGGPCRRVVVSEANALVLAHEIGHALRLQHVLDDDQNLMAPKVINNDLTDRQIRRLERALSALNSCTGRGAQ